jgi:hypothetical protein
MMIEALRSPEMTVLTTATWRHTQADGIHHSLRRANLKSYKGYMNSLERRKSYIQLEKFLSCSEVLDSVELVPGAQVSPFPES